jgi:outer membrane protein TolC
MQKADVAFEVAQLYEGLLLARDAQRYFEEIDHWLDRTLQSTQAKLNGGIGSVSERDVLRLQSARAATAIGIHQAEAGGIQARAGLAAYLGFGPGEDIQPAEDELAPVGRLPGDVDALIGQAAARRPELTALAEGAAALTALARAEAAGRRPDVFVMGFLDAAYTPGRDWIQSRFIVDPLNHVIPGALLGLRWQFQGGMAAARAEEQRARADVLARTGDWAGTGIPAELRKAYEDVRRADRDLASAADAVKKAKQWMVQSAADYSVGLLDLREVSDAVAAYVSLRTAVMKSHFDHNVGMAALSRAAGTLDSGGDDLYLATDPHTTVKP